jgi:predicted MFS family arabinose efflux permease
MASNPVALPSRTTPGAAQSPLPGARLALALLLSINLFNYIDRQMLAAVESPIEKEFFPDATAQLVKTKMGLLQTAFMVTYMTIAPLFGWLADRMSRWLLIGVGVILWSLASGASGLASGFLVLLVTRCFVGIGEAAYGPAAPTIISDLYPVKIRGSVLSWFYAAIPVGSALGYVLGGAVASLTGKWQWGFYLVVPPGVVLGLCCFFLREPRRGQADIDGEHLVRRPRLADYLVLLRTPSYVLVTLGMTAMTFAYGGLGFWLPRYIVHDKQGGELGDVNLKFGIILAVTGLGATLVGGIVGDRLRGRFPGSYLWVSGLSMLIGFPMVLLVLRADFQSAFPWGWVCVFVACFCLFFNTGPTNTVLANVSHPSMRATAFALNILVLHLFGDAFSPAAIGAVADHSSLDVGFLVVSFTILLGGLLWLWGARYLERDTVRAPLRLASENEGST